MRILILIFILLFSCTDQISAQGKRKPVDTSKKGAMFFYWGYNRSYFSKTNIHFTGPNYDFTVYDVKGTDRPVKFGWKYLNPGTITIPQYNFRLGYFITNKLAVSIGMDHMKYVVTQDQIVKMSGVITPEASLIYEGTYLNEDIKLDKEFLSFEHTNGFNLASIDVEYLQPIASVFNDQLSFSWNVGIGGIWIVAKTDVRVMGDGLDNDFHIAGYSLAAKTGPRIEYRNLIFLLAELKGGYASLPSVLVKNAEPEIGDHNLSYLEYYIALGVNFKLKRKKKNK